MNAEAPLKILSIEDEHSDFLLIERLLTKVFPEKFELLHSASLQNAGEQLLAGTLDLILLDLDLPDSKGIQTVQIVQQLAPDVPIVVLSGLNEDEFALQCLQEGAQDFLVKGQMDRSSIMRAVRYAIERKKFYEQEKHVQELRDALANVKVLRGLLPICAGCKRVRNDAGYWAEVEIYLMKNSELKFSHGICPDCASYARGKIKTW